MSTTDTDTKWRGNTTSRHCCFTSYKPTGVAYDEKTMRYLVYQAEHCPTTGKAHWQGYVEFLDSYRYNRIKTILNDDKCHIEKRNGSRDQARDYCRDATKRAAGTQVYEFGTWDSGGQGKRSDLSTAIALGSVDSIKAGAPEVYVKYHRGLEKLFTKGGTRSWKPIVKVYYGETGTGKSLAVDTECKGNNPFWKAPGHKWWDGYDGHEIIILDDFRGEWWSLDYMLRLLDRYALSVEIKGGVIPMLAKHIFITSDRKPESWWPTAGSSGTAQLLRRIDVIKRFRRLEDGTIEEWTANRG